MECRRKKEQAQQALARLEVEFNKTKLRLQQTEAQVKAYHDQLVAAGLEPQAASASASNGDGHRSDDERDVDDGVRHDTDSDNSDGNDVFTAAAPKPRHSLETSGGSAGGAGAGAGAGSASGGSRSRKPMPRRSVSVGNLSSANPAASPGPRRRRRDGAFLGGKLIQHTIEDEADEWARRARKSSVSTLPGGLEALMKNNAEWRRPSVVNGHFPTLQHVRVQTALPGFGFVWIGTWNMGAVDPFENMEPEDCAKV